KYKQIRVTSAKKRWGSCSHKGNISFSWRLIMATPSIIDYVIVHELAHLREYNHSKKFWQFVAKIIPYYKEQRKWLKDNGYTLIV
ncbi:MAG: M48 family metallopeptidase, partial [Patescibacteria group bacterium]|nr:M48 family metallopeptidase [Patescibacteria group bacterium]